MVGDDAPDEVGVGVVEGLHQLRQLLLIQLPHRPEHACVVWCGGVWCGGVVWWCGVVVWCVIVWCSVVVWCVIVYGGVV